MVLRHKIVRMFIGFAFLSGLGWLCDFVTFTLLIKLADSPAFIANFISSYVGITFVYFISLKTVFNKEDQRKGRFLLIYWTYQFFSILAYSFLLTQVSPMLLYSFPAIFTNGNNAIAAKIIVTPVNLLTNFLFMKFLTRFMYDEIKVHA